MERPETYAKIADTLSRVDERTQLIQREIQDIKEDIENSEEKLREYINERMGYLKLEQDSIKKQLNEEYVKKESFNPIQKIVYGLVGIILSTVSLSLLALVVIKP